MHFLEEVYYDNTVQNYLIAAGLILGIMLLIKLFRKNILQKLKTWSATKETTFDNHIINGVERFILPLLNVAAIYFGVTYLNLSEKVENLIASGITVVITFFAIRIISSSIKLSLEAYARKQEGGEEKVKQLKGIMAIINIILWSLGAVFLFDNLGYNVTAIVTGLGIGGIAIALAAQNILGDLFNYFVIFFDRPFEIGDFIVIDDKKGNVEYVGIKTTRIKSLSGEQIVISNSDLTNSRLHNFKRMEKRRILFMLGVTYQTTPEQLKSIPDIIKKIITDQPSAEFDRCHFSTFGDFSLNFETVYFVTEPDYTKYMEVQQAINLRIFEEFAAHKIEFAYPTRTIFIENGNRVESPDNAVSNKPNSA